MRGGGDNSCKLAKGVSSRLGGARITGLGSLCKDPCVRTTVLGPCARLNVIGSLCKNTVPGSLCQDHCVRITMLGSLC